MPRRRKKYGPPRGTRFDNRALNTTVKDIYDILNSLEAPVARAVVVRSASGTSGGVLPVGGKSFLCGEAVIPDGETEVYIVLDGVGGPLSAVDLTCTDSCYEIQVTQKGNAWGAHTKHRWQATSPNTFKIEVNTAPSGESIDFAWLLTECKPVADQVAGSGTFIAFTGELYDGKSANAWEGVYMFDVGDPEGTMQRLFKSADRSGVATLALHEGVFLYYASNDPLGSGKTDVRKVLLNGRFDQSAALSTALDFGGYFARGQGYIIIGNANFGIYRMEYDGAGETLIASVSVSHDLAMNLDGISFLHGSGTEIVQRLIDDGTKITEITLNGGRIVPAAAAGRIYIRFRDASNGSLGTIRSYDEDLTGEEIHLFSLNNAPPGVSQTTQDYGLGVDEEAGHIYSTERDVDNSSFGIARWDLDSFSNKTFIAKVRHCEHLAVCKPTNDPFGGYVSNVVEVFYTDAISETVHRGSPAFLSERVEIASLAGARPEGCDYDNAEGYLYVCAYTTGKIIRMRRDGTDQTDWLTGLTQPLSVRVTTDKVYWSEDGGQRVVRCNKDTTNEEVLDSGYDAGYIDVDVVAEKVYVPDMTNNLILRMGLDGSSQETIDTLSTETARGVAVDDSGTYYYYGLTTGNVIYRRLKDGSAAREAHIDDVDTNPAYALSLDKGTSAGGLHLYAVAAGIARSYREDVAGSGGDTEDVGYTPLFSATNLRGVALRYI